MKDLVRRLERAADYLRAADDVELAELGAAIATWIDVGEGVLDDALGLGGEQGRRSWRTERQLERRDHLVREAAAQWFGHEASPADVLASVLRRYARTSWRRDRVADACPDRLIGTAHESLWRILKARPVELTGGHVRRILSRPAPAGRAGQDPDRTAESVCVS
jgi:hypothetical protein